MAVVNALAVSRAWSSVASSISGVVSSAILQNTIIPVIFQSDDTVLFPAILSSVTSEFDSSSTMSPGSFASGTTSSPQNQQVSQGATQTTTPPASSQSADSLPPIASLTMITHVTLTTTISINTTVHSNSTTTLDTAAPTESYSSSHSGMIILGNNMTYITPTLSGTALVLSDCSYMTVEGTLVPFDTLTCVPLTSASLRPLSSAPSSLSVTSTPSTTPRSTASAILASSPMASESSTSTVPMPSLSETVPTTSVTAISVSPSAAPTSTRTYSVLLDTAGIPYRTRSPRSCASSPPAASLTGA